MRYKFTPEDCKKGGRSLVQKHGRSHMKKIGRKGGIAFWEKYCLIPLGINNFAIQNKETQEIVGTILGRGL